MHFTFYREFISFAVIKSILFISRFFEVIKIIIEFIIFHLIYTDRKLFELFIVKMAYKMKRYFQKDIHLSFKFNKNYINYWTICHIGKK